MAIAVADPLDVAMGISEPVGEGIPLVDPMTMPGMASLVAGCLFCILGISMDAMDPADGDDIPTPMSMPSPSSAARTDSGRHWTLPCPLARRLSTQLGKAPVSKY